MEPSSIPLVDVTADYRQHTPLVTAAIHRVLQSGRFILGPEVSELETSLANYVRASTDSPVYCIGVSDGTTAIQLCLMALGIGQGDEVISVPFTWISTAEVIPLVGAKTVFVDVDPHSYVIDPQLLRHRLTEKTKAVIVVSLFGLVPDLRGLRGILDEAQASFGTTIHIIEDGAQSFGSERQGFKSCGSPHAILSTTSFFPTKPLACYGDGGAVFTRSAQLADTIRSLRVHGKENKRHVRVGLNARLDTIQAAVLLAKFSYFDESVAARRTAAKQYSQLLWEDGRVIIPSYEKAVKEDQAICVYGVYTVLIAQRDNVMKRMKDAGISCAVYYPTCCHLQPVFASRGPVPALPVAERLSGQALALPMHAYLSKETQIRVVAELRAALDALGVTAMPQ